ncbi:hypothetical protein ACH4UT_28985, partial [Streptomyces sp. NPDC020799]
SCPAGDNRRTSPTSSATQPQRTTQPNSFGSIHRILLAELNTVGELDWSRACVDGSHIRAKKVPL